MRKAILLYIFFSHSCKLTLVLFFLQRSSKMSLAIFVNKFNQGINWNALFYFTHKITTTLVTFVAFTTLTVQDFSLWATTQSIIFLTLLWIDFGFRKSIPRFCPEFAKDKNIFASFVRNLIWFQTTALGLTTPLMWLLLIKFTSIQAYSPTFLWLSLALFLTEGITALIRLIYHAHFWHKQFNSIAIGIVFIEALANLGILFTLKNSPDIITGLFTTKICASIVLNALTIFFLPQVNTSNTTTNEHDTRTLYISFIKHSAIMWFSNNIKSLSERNALIPYLTLTLGPIQANSFKVAHDCAMFFHRSVIKSIGSTDTALLSHVHTLAEEKIAMPIAFKKLLSKIAGLCIPLLGFCIIFACICMYKNVGEYGVFQTFIIIAAGYLLETLMSPYERVLEVYKDYWALLVAYAPYIIMLIALVLLKAESSIGLVGFILVLHGVRLVSSLLIMRYAQTQYALNSSFSELIVSFLPLRFNKLLNKLPF